MILKKNYVYSLMYYSPLQIRNPLEFRDRMAGLTNILFLQNKIIQTFLCRFLRRIIV